MCNEANSHQHDDTIGFQWDAMQTVFSCNFAHVLSHTNWCHAKLCPPQSQVNCHMEWCAHKFAWVSELSTSL